MCCHEVTGSCVQLVHHGVFCCVVVIAIVVVALFEQAQEFFLTTLSVLHIKNCFLETNVFPYASMFGVL